MAGSGFDLRDFVATALGTEIDESAPLSASDLRILSDKLHTRSDQLKDRLQKVLTHDYDQFMSIIQDAHIAAADVESLAEDVKKVLDALGEKDDPGGEESELKKDLAFDIEICGLAAAVDQLRKKQEERREYIAAVEFIEAVHEGIQAAERACSKGDFIEAGAKLCQIREQLELPSDWTGDRDDEKERDAREDKVQAFILLEDEWASCYYKLGRFLENLFSKAVVLDLQHFQLCIYSCVSCSDTQAGMKVAEVQLRTILSAMDQTGALDTRLAKTADLLFKQIIDPIIRDPGFPVLIRDSDQGGQSVISWRPSLAKTDIGGNAEMFTRLLEVFKFLKTNLVVENDDWMERLGRVIWPQLAESVIINCLRKAVPNEASELAGFQELALETAEFEASLGRAGLIPGWDENRGDKLRSFSSDMELHFAVKKRKLVVAKARDLLSKSDYRSHVVNEEKTRKGVNDCDDISLLQTEACTITVTAKQLLELIHETLQDACNTSPSIAMELYHAARDALLLYRAILPVKAMDQLNSVHKVAVMCHNDCFYIANECLFLSFQYKPALPSNVQQIMSFVDFAPLFRRAGCDILEKQMHLIMVDLMQALDQANGFQYTEQKKYYDICSNAINQAVIVLEAVRMGWQPVLATSVYHIAFPKLVDAVVTRLTNEVVAFADISVAEGEQLRKLMLSALESMSSLILDPAKKDADEGSGDRSRDSLEKMVPSWRKLMRLTDLLDMSLRPITQSWESGDLASCGFSSDEVQHLVKAIFSDTPLRSECLKVIVDSHVK